ncbi:MTHFR-domain-containing protein [Neoconidiobolus thromboides FSU 785]|nr:MTHFR-domain-containing protein [Neoconidiobolus thromboides FSU 785]
MKIVDLLKYNKNSKKPSFSFEFFPPKTSEGKKNLDLRIARLQELGPIFNSVTWGAGGSTNDKSLELANTIQNDLGLDVLLHITATNTSKKEVLGYLQKAKELGIENILALRGDSSNESLFLNDEDKEDRLETVIDLIKLIKSEFKNQFNVGVTGYPSSHPESQGLEEDIKYLKQKVESGADFVLTQFFLSNEEYDNWYNEIEKNGLRIDIIPSILVIQSYISFRRLINLTGIKIPKEILVELEEIKHDDLLIKEYGINLAIKLIKNILNNNSDSNNNQIHCIHFFTMNLEKSVHEVLNRLKWIKDNNNNFTIENQTLLNTIEGWDNFPNGRFGDASSPAYGNLEGYRNGLKISPGKALELWGHPKSKEEISALFIAFLNGKLSELPWCETGDLDPESELIKNHLIKINQNLSFTLASQPSLDGIKSNHPIYGWGPKNGFIFQKAFIEVLISKAKINAFLAKMIALDPNITYMAIDSEGHFLSNKNKDGEEYEANTVTWGVFPHGEIAQATLIEVSSFKAWAKEVFQISNEWSNLFQKSNRESFNLINDLKDNYFLLNIVQPDFKVKSDAFFDNIIKALN